MRVSVSRVAVSVSVPVFGLMSMSMSSVAVSMSTVAVSMSPVSVSSVTHTAIEQRVTVAVTSVLAVGVTVASVLEHEDAHQVDQ